MGVFINHLSLNWGRGKKSKILRFKKFKNLRFFLGIKIYEMFAMGGGMILR